LEQQTVQNNFVKYCLEHGGNIAPLLFDLKDQKGIALANPSILKASNGIFYVLLRNINYFLYHSEKHQFQHRYGPLQYIHPENDVTLTTWNYLAELNPDTLEISNVRYIDTSLLDKKPLWTFIGLEDARLVEWEGKIYCSGVRRDTTTNGEGRIELSEIQIKKNSVKEISRNRLPTPNNIESYCEKNWMPILDQPFHYVKWSNPTQVVSVDISSKKENTCKTEFLDESSFKEGYSDFRGGSQVIPFGPDKYIALIHETYLFKNHLIQKNAEYKHRFLIWDHNWNLIHISPSFHFLDGQIEFGVGMTIDSEKVYITFSFQDNVSFVLRLPIQTLIQFIYSKSYEPLNASFKYETPLEKYIENHENPYRNFDLGQYYEKMNHLSPAISFYLRAADRTMNTELQYVSLLRMTICINQLSNRYHTVKAILNRAIELFPDRPEAYFFLSSLEEEQKNHHDGYMFASIGHEFKDNEKVNVSLLPEYPHLYGNLLLKAIHSWYIGNAEESRKLFLILHFHYRNIMSQSHYEIVLNNLRHLKFPWKIVKYEKSYLDDLNYKFPGVENIEQNYAQILQDFFVLTTLNGKRNGTYLEIGAESPHWLNNTLLLEKDFDWKGVSVEILPEKVEVFNKERKNPCLCRDGLEINYDELMKEFFPDEDYIDYLQVDCEPPETSFAILKKIINESNKKFRTITFEQDFYVDSNSNVRKESRDFLKKHGYVLLVPDASFDNESKFEDWWVLESEISSLITNSLNIKSGINFVKDVFFNTQK
jgi:hypothetical protein